MADKTKKKRFDSSEPGTSATGAKEIKLLYLFFGITVIGLTIVFISHCAKDVKPPKPPRHLSGAPKTKQRPVATKKERRGYELTY